MKFLLSILVIIDNLNVLLANNENCRENDLNALMVRLRQLRTEFNNLKIQHDDRIDQINATQAVLKEANDTQETELEKLRKEFNNTSSELKKLRQEFRNTSLELEKLRREFNKTSSELDKLRRNTSSEIAAIKDKSLLPIVGFNARLSSTKTVSQGDEVVFEIVMINKGEGYDNSTGIFTAPYTGLYFFSVHVCSGAGSYVAYAIYKDGSQLTRSTQYDNYIYSCSSVSTIALVNKAERVWVQILESSLFMTDSVRWNTFSGYLLNK